MNSKMKNSLALTLFLFFSVLLCGTLSSPPCHPDDRKALSQILEALGLSPLNPAIDCCKLGYVNCYPERLSTLILQGIPQASGQISPAIADLPYLESLYFHHLPNLTGTIPPSIVKLTRLEFLDISFTGVSGPIPPFLAKLKNLGGLRLSHNSFTGSIPPQLSQLKKISVFDLSRNKLTGTIPESFSLFTDVDLEIDLSHNQLSGPIPKSFSKLTNGLDLSRNNLTGDASFLLGNNTTFRYIDLSRNNLTFDLSKAELSETLTSLDLNHNKIFGSLPQQFTQSKVLSSFNVSYNRLCGQIPQGGNLQNFSIYSYFHNRCLCGPPLPPCTGSDR